MNDINLDTIRVGAMPLGVGDETAATPPAGDTKIVTGANVIVSSAFDTLIDKLTRETEKSLDQQSRTRLSLAISTIAARAGITSAAQLAALDECDRLINQIAEDKATLEEEQAELVRLQEELKQAKAEKEPSETKIKELETQINACAGRIAVLGVNIAANKVKLNETLDKLDDKSSRVLAAAIRVASTTSANYLDSLRELTADQDDQRLEAIDAFTRLLGGDDFEKILLEELGIRA